MLGQPLSSLFTAWWRQSQDFTEMAPLAASQEAPVTYSGKCRAGKSYAGVQSAVRHLRCSEPLYQQVAQPRHSTFGFPWSVEI